LAEGAKATFLSEYFSHLTTVLTIYALFGDDIRVAFTSHDADDVFDGCTIVALVIFATEVVALSFFRRDYFMGFFFWLDLVATTSLLTDITYVHMAMNECDEECEQDNAMTRGARAGRVGTKAARMMRIIRLVRLVRIVKLYDLYFSLFEEKKSRRNTRG